jgi:hypothetical protein
VILVEGEAVGSLVLALVGPLVLLGAAADEVLLVEVWYPKSSTTMVTVDASEMTIRLIDSPSEAFAVDTAAGNTGGKGKPFRTVGPSARSAEKDVAFGEVWDPPLQCDHFGQPLSRRSED